jgi:uncharacterized membrane protein
METDHYRSLQERVEQLEGIVSELQRRLDLSEKGQAQTGPAHIRPSTAVSSAAVTAAQQTPRAETDQPPSFSPGSAFREDGHPERPTPPPPPDAVPASPHPAPVKKSFELPEHMRRGEYWLNKVGIGLVLFAVAFLFKYSIDQGWLTPPIRIAFGLALGVALNAIGLGIYSKRRHFSQVLIGGGIATFYITGFAAFQLFALVTHPVAMGFMVAVTLLAFAVSLKQNEAVLSLIGAIGGLVTPFLLYTGAGNVPQLVAYTCLVLAGTGGIYFFKGWRSLLWVSVIGGWTVLLVAFNAADLFVFPNVADQRALQLGVLFAWLMFWALPVGREVVWVINPDRWARSLIGFGDKTITDSFRGFLDRHVHVLTVVTAGITVVISMSVWQLSEETQGWIIMGGSMIYWAVAWNLKGFRSLRALAYTHAVIGALLFTVSLCLVMSGDTLFFALAAEVAVIHLLARRLSDRGLSIGGHILFGIVGCCFLVRILEGPAGGTAVFNAPAMTDLWAVAVWLAVSRIVRQPVARSIYLLVAGATLAGVFCRELDGNLLYLVLTIEAVLLHTIARYISDRVAVWGAHVLFAGLCIQFIFDRFVADTVGSPMVNWQGLADLFLIVSAVGLSWFLDSDEERIAYRVGPHILLLALFFREFASLVNGQGYVTIAWGVYAVILLVIGLRLDHKLLRSLGLATLLLVVGKLFLVDLSHLETIWRILLFFGFGAAFLVISFFFKAMWKSGKTPDDVEGKQSRE